MAWRFKVNTAKKVTVEVTLYPDYAPEYVGELLDDEAVNSFKIIKTEAAEIEDEEKCEDCGEATDDCECNDDVT